MSPQDHDDPDRKLTGLLARVLGPVGPEVTCEQCFELLDQYVELEVAGSDAATEMPGLAAHLEGCPACHEDYESLRDFVAGLSPRGETGDG